jgi:hypothetical protein
MTLLTIVHVLISLAGIGAGLIVIAGFMAGNRFPRWNLLFLAATTATSLTGFLFPIEKLTPGIIVGIVSLGVLGLAFAARAKNWPKTYILTASAAEFLNVLILITQLFEKVPALHQYAPAGTEPVVAIVQGLASVFFALLAVSAVRRSIYTVV